MPTRPEDGTDTRAGNGQDGRPDLSKIILLLDFDGTLVDIANAPDEVAVSYAVRRRVYTLDKLMGGAFAIVSGRDLDVLTNLFPDYHGAIFASHGAERLIDGEISRVETAEGLDAAAAALEGWASDKPGIIVERKHVSVVLHFRKAPSLEDQAHDLCKALLRSLPHYHLAKAKMAFELKPEGISKKDAAEQMKARFPDRTLVAIGDDATDETMFEAAERAGGFGIKVGEGETCASRRVSGAADVARMLDEWIGGEPSPVAPRLIVVSNRVPSDEVPSGGLVVALDDCLRENGGLWIGPEVGKAFDDLHFKSGSGRYKTACFGITPKERDEYYLGYANSVLWPLCHRRTDLIVLRREHFEAYRDVNRRAATAIAGTAAPADTIWVHDYHFLPLAYELRKAGVRNHIGLFLHIPFPTSADLVALPQRTEFFEWLASFDLVGLQSERDVARCLEAFRALPDCEMMLDGSLKLGDRRFRVASFPIGIDVEGFRSSARDGGREMLRLSPDERLAVGAERLDYSKGIPQRLAAFEHWLTKNPGKRLTHLQVAPPSRDEVAAYQDLAAQVRSAAGRINGVHATLDWTPLKLLIQPTPRETLATLFRGADIGLVTPLADGMNLVAKEFVAAQRDEDPGVLILSRMAGAAEALEDALLVNPYDASEVSDAISQALAMPLAERQERQARLLAAVRKSDICNWAASFLAHLSGSMRRKGGGT